MKKRSEKSIRSTNRNWALFDLGGMRSKIGRMQSQGVISPMQGAKMMAHIEGLAVIVKAYKP